MAHDKAGTYSVRAHSLSQLRGRGIDDRQLRTRKLRTEEFEAQWPTIQVDQLLHEISATGAIEHVYVSSWLAQFWVAVWQLHCGAQAGRDRYAVQMLEYFCRQLGLERAFLQTDPENAAIDFVNTVCGKPTHPVSRESIGKVELHHPRRIGCQNAEGTGNGEAGGAVPHRSAHLRLGGQT